MLLLFSLSLIQFTLLCSIETISLATLMKGYKARFTLHSLNRDNIVSYTNERVQG